MLICKPETTLLCNQVKAGNQFPCTALHWLFKNTLFKCACYCKYKCGYLKIPAQVWHVVRSKLVLTRLFFQLKKQTCSVLHGRFCQQVTVKRGDYWGYYSAWKDSDIHFSNICEFCNWPQTLQNIYALRHSAEEGRGLLDLKDPQNIPSHNVLS